MIKILPIKKENIRYEPRFVLEVTIGYGEHCDDTFTKRHLIIVESMKGHPDSWNYIKRKDAEKIYRFFKKILEREKCRHIILNDAWELAYEKNPSTYWYGEYMDKKEIKQFSKYYETYQCSLFNPEVEYNWYGLKDINIYYYDENGNKHDCEVIDE